MIDFTLAWLAINAINNPLMMVNEMNNVIRVNREDFLILRKLVDRPIANQVVLLGIIFISEEEIEKPKLMTREETNNKVFNAICPQFVKSNCIGSIHDEDWKLSKKIVTALDALGLLKLAEEKKERTLSEANQEFTPMIIRLGSPTYIIEKHIYETWKGPIEALVKAGYSIRKEN